MDGEIGFAMGRRDEHGAFDTEAWCPVGDSIADVMDFIAMLQDAVEQPITFAGEGPKEAEGDDEVLH